MLVLNKTIASLIGFGAGIAATVYSQRQDYMDGKQWKRMRRKMKRAFR
ncbi:YrzQ family protein [Falsibacillus albus]|uniref:DUF3918 domain-containing protein n=1 Tax=Falsibacillus albus TaxID=2478915 RepID=A0A3L7K520_9BACI|nr:YrzQ family protein [Falsibacillus albus]RLQ98118.1 DUF3918 domain-containing protein [Falsibacillus albus]